MIDNGYEKLGSDEKAFLCYLAIPNGKKAAIENFGLFSYILLKWSVKKKLTVKTMDEAIRKQEEYIRSTTPTKK